MIRVVCKVLSGLLGLLLLMLLWLSLTQHHESLLLDGKEREKLVGTYLELPQGVVHYELAGPADGPPVVLVHGFSVPSLVWEPTFNTLADQGFRVLRFDLYGRGLSDRPDLDYSIDVYVDQLAQLTHALLPDKKLNLVGLSMGGLVATRFAGQHPERLQSLSLLAPLVQTPRNAAIYPLLIPGLGEWLADVAVVPLVLGGVDKAVYREESFPDWRQQMTPQTQYVGYSRALLKTMRQLHDQNFIGDYQVLSRLPVPMQLIWGREDATLPFAHSDLLRDAVPGLAFHPLSETGHLPHYDQTKRVNSLLSDFLNNARP